MPTSLRNLILFSFSDSVSDHCYDVVVIGGGIVGAATAREVLTRYPNLKCAIVEKEDSFGIFCNLVTFLKYIILHEIECEFDVSSYTSEWP